MWPFSFVQHSQQVKGIFPPPHPIFSIFYFSWRFLPHLCWANTLAEVILIQKSGDYEDLANTRPVSLVPIVSNYKVCEKSALSQFTDFLDSNDIIYHSQSGNWKFHSTETALLHYTDELLKNMDDKKISMIVLLGMSIAFDSIRHDLLINKLYK